MDKKPQVIEGFANPEGTGEGNTAEELKELTTITVVFPDGPHTTNAGIQTTGGPDLGQMQIACDLMRRETDSSFDQIKKMMGDPQNRAERRRKGLFLPGN